MPRGNRGKPKKGRTRAGAGGPPPRSSQPIPGYKPPKPKPKRKKPKKNYKVKKGDSYLSIAQDLYGDQEAADRIVRVNPDLDALRPGMIISLPAVPGSPLTAGAKNYNVEAIQSAPDYNPYAKYGEAATQSIENKRAGFPDYTGPRNPLEAIGGAFRNLFVQPDPNAAPLPTAPGSPIGLGYRPATRGGRGMPENQILRNQMIAQRQAAADAAALKRVHDVDYLTSGAVSYGDPPEAITEALAQAEPGRPSPGRFGGRRRVDSLSSGRMVGESPVYQIWKGESPDWIDPRSAGLLKMSDEDLAAAGYRFDDEAGVWRKLAVVPQYTAGGAGAYSGYGQIRRYRGGGRGGGGGGGGGGRRVAGAPGTGGYKPPPGTFGLVTWRL